MRCDVYVRYVFKNDTNGRQDVSSVRWILECQFVFLRGPYVTQCAEMTRGYIVRGKHACVLRLYGVLKLNQLTPVLVRSTTLTNTSGIGIARESVLTRWLI